MMNEHMNEKQTLHIETVNTESQAMNLQNTSIIVTPLLRTTRPCRWGRTLNMLLLSGMVMGSLSTSAQAAIALDRTRVVFDGDVKSVSLNISNQNKQLPYLAQGWMEDPNGTKIQSPFTVLPPVQRIEPGKPSQVKIQALPVVNTLPQDKESLFYFNLREIPPKSSKPNTLQIALQTRIKMFYRPKGLAIDPNAAPPQDKITLTKQGDNYVVNNPTPYYVTFVDASRQKDTTGAKDFEPMMVSPKSSMPLTVNASAIGNNPVLTYVNDYGGRPQLSFRCTGTTCVVIPEKN